MLLRLWKVVFTPWLRHIAKREDAFFIWIEWCAMAGPDRIYLAGVLTGIALCSTIVAIELRRWFPAYPWTGLLGPLLCIVAVHVFMKHFQKIR